MIDDAGYHADDGHGVQDTGTHVIRWGPTETHGHVSAGT